MCVWFDQNNQNKELCHREVPELSVADLTNFTRRKDLTASGDGMRDSRDNKTIAQVSQEAGCTSEVSEGVAGRGGTKACSESQEVRVEHLGQG